MSLLCFVCDAVTNFAERVFFDGAFGAILLEVLNFVCRSYYERNFIILNSLFIIRLLNSYFVVRYSAAQFLIRYLY